MFDLQIQLFGNVHITSDGVGEIRLTRSTQYLLAYLLLNRDRNLTRDALADVFWNDFDAAKARNCLNTALWRLRTTLIPVDRSSQSYIITNHLGEVCFNNESNYWLDVEKFEEQASELLQHPVEKFQLEAAARLEKCLELYKGELLEGCYQDWALMERERLRLLYLKCLGFLMDFYQHAGAHEKAIACGQRILTLDPLREEIHRCIMRLYVLCGQRPQALQQYHVCCGILSDELDVLPMEETQLLYAQIALGSSTLKSGSVDGLSTLSQMVTELSYAVHSLEENKNQIKAIIHRLEQILKADP